MGPWFDCTAGMATSFASAVRAASTDARLVAAVPATSTDARLVAVAGAASADARLAAAAGATSANEGGSCGIMEA